MIARARLVRPSTDAGAPPVDAGPTPTDAGPAPTDGGPGVCPEPVACTGAMTIPCLRYIGATGEICRRTACSDVTDRDGYEAVCHYPAEPIITLSALWHGPIHASLPRDCSAAASDPSVLASASGSRAIVYYYIAEGPRDADAIAAARALLAGLDPPPIACTP